MFLIGQGMDAHRFAPDRPLVLGGVRIPDEPGLRAHSDGDVVIHALCDALLGAATLGDIGRHFPDSDARYRHIDSRVLLRQTMEKLRARKLRVQNADLTIIAQKPKLSPYFEAMRSILAQELSCPPNRVNLKATTTEGMGFTGRKEGIAALAVVLLREVSQNDFP